jgi:hypothetical protein
MASITFSDLLTTIFVLVDDWYQIHGIQYLAGKPGPKPEFTDSEVITLMLAMDYLPFPSETQFIAYIRANYLSLFPKLVDQSQFNRRARALRLLFVEALRRYWLAQRGPATFLIRHHIPGIKPPNLVKLFFFHHSG